MNNAVFNFLALSFDIFLYWKKSKFVPMAPDYPHKIFCDKRGSYNLLMEVLAMDGNSA